MLTLSLLRHAKSSWAEPNQKDFDRPLAERGIEAGPRMGAYMAAHGIAPQLVICSTAVRTRQTLALVRPHLAGDPRIELEDTFYLAAPSLLLARARKTPAEIQHVMLIGHDPGMHGLANELAGKGDPQLLQALAYKFPTAGLAVITFNAKDWSRIARGRGELAHFMAPKRLP